MIIQELVKAYDRLAKNPDCQVTRDGFCFDVISNFIVIDKDGNLKDVIENTSPSPEKVLENAKKNTTEAWYLIDSFDYLLGLNLDKNTGLWIEALDSKNDTKRLSGQAYITKFELFKTKNLTFLKSIHSAIADAIVNLLTKWNPAQNINHDALYSFSSGEKKAKKIEGRCAFVLDSVVNKSYLDKDILDAWNVLIKICTSSEECIGQCAISGKNDVLVKNHKPIKLSGPQGKDAHFISLDKATAAFQSYGKLEGYNSPISNEIMNKYTSALTYFYRKGSKNKYRLGDDTLLFWAESDLPYEDTVLSMLGASATKDESETVEDAVSSSLKQLTKGFSPDDIADDIKFHILIISPNSARLSVKRYLNTTFGDFKKNVELHESDMSIIDSYGQVPKTSFRSIIDATVSSIYKNNRESVINPNFSSALFDSVLNGGLYPASIYLEMLARLKTDNPSADDPKRAGIINYLFKQRIAYIKAYLVRKNRFENKKEEIKMSLNHESTNEAYLLGRLFAVMEKVQTEAIRGINTTIKDRFFASACSTPSAVFPTLLASYSNNISKLEGGGIRFEKIVSEIFNLLENDEFAKQLNLDQQGSFMIGYHQQFADFYTKKENNN